jgi:hypothetical protein
MKVGELMLKIQMLKKDDASILHYFLGQFSGIWYDNECSRIGHGQHYTPCIEKFGDPAFCETISPHQPNKSHDQRHWHYYQKGVDVSKVFFIHQYSSFF